LYFCCHMYSFVRNFNCKACNVSPNVPQWKSQYLWKFVIL
jgi:hypothetical protein